MQLPSFIGTCYSHKGPVSQERAGWAVSRPFPISPKFVFTSREHTVDVTASCPIAAPPRWRPCPVQWAQHRRCPPRPEPGACRSPRSQGMLQRTRTSQSQCGGRREDATHKRVTTTPTQLWHNVLDTPPWQPRSVSDDCGFPLWRRGGHTRRGVSPLPLHPFSHREKSHWNLPSFLERDILNPTGDTESEQIQRIPLCQLVTAHPAAVSVQYSQKQAQKIALLCWSVAIRW